MRPLSLIGAAERGRIEEVKKLVESGSDIHAVNSRGHNALRGAVSERHIDVAEFLLDKGADVNAASEFGWRALHLAARNGDVAMLNLLLARGAEVDAKTLLDETALYMAAQKGHTNAIDLLSRAHADPNSKNEDGWTPLYAAVGNGHVDATQLLLANGANVCFKYRLRYTNGTDFIEVRETALHLAAECEHGQLVEFLLDAGANPSVLDGSNNSPLLLALRAGNAEIVRQLSARADTLSDKRWKDLLNEAIANGKVACLDALLSGPKALFNMKDRGRRILMSALTGEHFEKTVAVLVARGADVNGRDSKGQAPLHEIAGRGGLRVEELLHGGADHSARDRDFATPLHLAAYGSPSAVRALLEFGADVSATNRDGFTPLHFAASGISDYFRRASLEMDIDIGLGEPSHVEFPPVSDDDLFSTEIIELLISHGADVNVRASDGTTPLSAAGCEAISAFLVARGAMT